jgi:hypothetical protein
MPSKIRKPKKVKLRIPLPRKPPKTIAPKKGKGAKAVRRKDWIGGMED